MGVRWLREPGSATPVSWPSVWSLVVAEDPVAAGYGGSCGEDGGLIERREAKNRSHFMRLDSLFLLFITLVYGDGGPVFGLAVPGTEVVSFSRTSLHVSGSWNSFASPLPSRCSMNLEGRTDRVADDPATGVGPRVALHAACSRKAIFGNYTVSTRTVSTNHYHHDDFPRAATWRRKRHSRLSYAAVCDACASILQHINVPFSSVISSDGG